METHRHRRFLVVVSYQKTGWKDKSYEYAETPEEAKKCAVWRIDSTESYSPAMGKPEFNITEVDSNGSRI